MDFAKFKALTRLEQTLFVLPFLIGGVLLSFLPTEEVAGFDQPDFWKKLLWVLPAFLAARISGISFNQFLDRHSDAKNPRTLQRPLPAGVVTSQQALVTAFSSLGIFHLCAWYISPLCFLLSIPIGGLMIFYSYMKRFSSLCNLVIGVIHFLTPIMTFLAIHGSMNLLPVILGLVAFFSITGNEMIYALQDLEFDKREGLHSIPVVLGEKASYLFSRALHLGCVMSFFLLGVFASFPWFFYFGPLILAVNFVHFHIKAPHDMKEALFFSSVVIVSLTVLIFVSLGVLWVAM